jgi:hypothetical protein
MDFGSSQGVNEFTACNRTEARNIGVVHQDVGIQPREARLVGPHTRRRLAEGHTGLDRGAAVARHGD